MRSLPLQENSNRFGHQNEMDTRTPKATSSKASSLRAAGLTYSQPSADLLIAEGGIDRTASAWHGPLISRDGPAHEKRYPIEYASSAMNQEELTSSLTYPPPPAPPTTPHFLDYPEELARMIVTMRPGQYHEALAEAYREASDIPPITQQSLSELDIQHIITNVRLRHDVNFDRDLSFRPNLDGAKGQQKRQATCQYWKALEAELELYARLFQGTPAPKIQEGHHWAGLVQNAQRRIPVMFRTIQEVLKSLVPDRDHARVDEHLDVSMLMQEIQRGVCDLVRLAEWMAQLLKEHCAPMRDSLVDGMVTTIRSGVAEYSSAQIVDGLRELFGLLETMKLVGHVLLQMVLALTSLQDVANHQIRNLKTLLVEDTINFETHYHLDRLVSHRSRVNLDAAQAWYHRATCEFAEDFSSKPRNVQHVQLETFARAVIAQLFNRDGRHEFPETFYLDQDRLRSLRLELEDLTHIEVCMDVFAALLKQFGYDSIVSSAARHQLHASLLAIMGSATAHGSRQWRANSEALSLEILRQASLVVGQPLSFSHDTLSSANNQLLHMFCNSFITHNPRVESIVLHRVLTCTNRNVNSTAMDFFNNLVPLASSISPTPSQFSHLRTSNTSSSLSTLSPEMAKWQDIANRITHIILLHWRIWGRIAYVQENVASDASQEAAVTSPQLPPHTTEHDQHMVTTMKTGEPLESGQETHVPHETSSQ
jgi:hypothetical protein